jgi:hypothetical protein
VYRNPQGQWLLENMLNDHIWTKRLLEIADEQSRLAAAEFEHLEICNECLTLFAKSILEVARARAKKKCSSGKIAPTLEPFR